MTVPGIYSPSQGETKGSDMNSMMFRIMADGLEHLRMGGEALDTMRKALEVRDLYQRDLDCILQWRTAGKRWKDVQGGELEGAIAFRDRP